MKRTAPSLPTQAAALLALGAAAADSVAMRAEAFPILHRAIGFDVGVLSTSDPATVLWTSCVLDGMDPDPARHSRLFHNEYVEGDLHPIAELARTSAGFAALSDRTEAERAASPRFQYLSAMGATDELRVAVRIDGACWGTFIAYKGGGTFDEEDRAAARALAPSIAQALRLSMLRHAALHPGADETPGVLAIAADGAISPLGDASTRWRDELTDAAGLPSPLVALCARAAAGEAHPRAVVQGRGGGWIQVHVVPGPTGTRLAIVEPARQVELAWTLAVAYGLTPRERTVVMGVARGLSAKEIAAELAISPWTVHDHVQAALAKVGVDSRQALVAHLFHEHVLPRRERGLHPGPWGWFAEPPQS
jgi:DNA-binding CsgD family transcriptional regulator